MTNPILAPLRDEIEQSRTVIKSATVLIQGIAARIQTAREEALANGASAEELQPFVDLEAGLESDRVALAAAVEANT